MEGIAVVGMEDLQIETQEEERKFAGRVEEGPSSWMRNMQPR